MRDEFQECTCIKPAVAEDVGDTRTTFCAKWECIDRADAAGYSYLEYETHTCSKRNADFGYCEKWDWQTDDFDSFENTACDCVETMTNSELDVTCKQFKCKEKGAEKISPNLLWALWALTMAIFPLSGGITFAIVAALLFICTCGKVNASNKDKLANHVTCGVSEQPENVSLLTPSNYRFLYSIIPFLLIPTLFGGIGAMVIGPLPCLLCTILFLSFTNYFKDICGSCGATCCVGKPNMLNNKIGNCDSETSGNDYDYGGVTKVTEGSPEEGAEDVKL
jgi:hypothetical protein